MLNILAKMSVGGWITLAIVLALIIAAVVSFCLIFPVKTYLKVRLSGARVPLKKLMEIKLSKVRLIDVVNAYLFARQAGVKISIDEVLSHTEAGGNIETVVRALAVAKESGIDMTFAMAKSLDLSGRNCLDAVQCCLVPKQIESGEVVAIAKDGIEVKMRLKATLRGNIRRILGGADEQTVMARIEESTSSAIGSAPTYREVVENPHLITDSVLKQDLDSGSMFELISVDAVSVVVGNNVKARLDAERAEATKRINVAKSEEERQKLICREQEAKVKTEELKGALAKEEAEVPKALVEALKKGKLSTMDYLNIENIKSDTRMRNAITESSAKKNNDLDFDL